MRDLIQVRNRVSEMQLPRLSSHWRLVPRKTKYEQTFNPTSLALSISAPQTKPLHEVCDFIWTVLFNSNKIKHSRGSAQKKGDLAEKQTRTQIQASKSGM